MNDTLWCSLPAGSQEVWCVRTLLHFTGEECVILWVGLIRACYVQAVIGFLRTTYCIDFEYTTYCIDFEYITYCIDFEYITYCIVFEYSTYCIDLIKTSL